MIFKRLIFVFGLLPVFCYSLEKISDDDLSLVTGQNGVSISGELVFNENGGPLLSTDTGNVDPNDGSIVWGVCDTDGNAVEDRCGARLAVKLNESGGWYALDELKGKVSFEGLTLKSREIINTATDATFGGDVADLTVLEIGLPNKVKFEKFSYSYVTSNEARPTDAGYSQHVRYGVDFNGSVNMQGNILIFPTGNP